MTVPLEICKTWLPQSQNKVIDVYCLCLLYFFHKKKKIILISLRGYYITWYTMIVVYIETKKTNLAGLWVESYG